jgi:hypothetical protein
MLYLLILSFIVMYLLFIYIVTIICWCNSIQCEQSSNILTWGGAGKEWVYTQDMVWSFLFLYFENLKHVKK